MLDLTYPYKLKLTPEQQQTDETCLETSRRVWNYVLAERKDWYKSRAYPTFSSEQSTTNSEQLPLFTVKDVGKRTGIFQI